MKPEFYIGNQKFYVDLNKGYRAPVIKQFSLSFFIQPFWLPALSIPLKEFLKYCFKLSATFEIDNIKFLTRFCKKKKIINIPSWKFCKSHSYIVDGKFAKGYYHFFFEELAAIIFIVHERRLDIKCLKVYIQKELFAEYQIDLLLFLGVTEENIIITDSKLYIFTGRYVVLNRHFDCYIPNIHLLRAFQRYINVKRTVKDSRKQLYISREDAQYRKFRDEIVEISKINLKASEIKIFKKMTLFEKATHCRDAASIYSIHGAGLCHVIFADHDTKVIEYKPNENGRFHQYQSICYLLGIRYSQKQLDHDADGYLII